MGLAGGAGRTRPPNLEPIGATSGQTLKGRGSVPERPRESGPAPPAILGPALSNGTAPEPLGAWFRKYCE